MSGGGTCRSDTLAHRQSGPPSCHLGRNAATPVPAATITDCDDDDGDNNNNTGSGALSVTRGCRPAWEAPPPGAFVTHAGRCRPSRVCPRPSCTATRLPAPVLLCTAVVQVACSGFCRLDSCDETLPPPCTRTQGGDVTTPCLQRPKAEGRRSPKDFWESRVWNLILKMLV